MKGDTFLESIFEGPQPIEFGDRPHTRRDLSVGKKKPAPTEVRTGLLVELRGLEPLTPTLPVWCATSCAIAP